LGFIRHCIPSEAKPCAVPPPPARRFGDASSADAANPRDRFYTTGFGNASTRNDGERPWKRERSEPVALAKSRHWFLGVAQVGINSPVKSINSPVNPLLIRCYGGRVSPVPAEFMAGSRGGERGFAATSLPRGLCSRRGERRSAMPSQFENPMTSPFQIPKQDMIISLIPERLRMLIRGER
jgi:hypothetical protein